MMKHFFKLFLKVAVFVFILPAWANANFGSMEIRDAYDVPQHLTYEIINGYAVVEGDIILGKIKELRAIILPKITGSLWPNALIPFEIDENLPFENKLAVMQAIALLKEKTVMEFVEITSSNRNQYPDYLYFTPVAGTTCASLVGKQGGRQEVLLAKRCNTMSTVHELCHALGMWHEQSRKDRDLYVRILWENIDPQHLYNFEQHLTDSRDYGEYDYDSIMHYQDTAFSMNGKKTIVPLKENVTIGQRDHLSVLDIKAIFTLYRDA